ncbi:hypothetical protein DF268_35540 [Streptomyces sp. V2]|nr:hypothetical protein DF268_35540 [Streptomyces sp. V2]
MCSRVMPMGCSSKEGASYIPGPRAPPAPGGTPCLCENAHSGAQTWTSPPALSTVVETCTARRRGRSAGEGLVEIPESVLREAFRALGW